MVGGWLRPISRHAGEEPQLSALAHRLLFSNNALSAIWSQPSNIVACLLPLLFCEDILIPRRQPSMAEVLGVVASGIAVAQAAQTVGQAVLSLTQLWKEIKDAPDTIQTLLDELGATGELVTAIESELESSLSSVPRDGASLTPFQCLAIQRCREIHKTLGDLVNDLTAEIASSRKRKRLVAKAKVALKKETLETYEKRLQKALFFLNSALQLNLA